MTSLLETRRHRLLEAAAAVFAREGLHAATMERIAIEAGVSRATVYAYLADKEDAFLQASQHLAGQLQGAVDFALGCEGEPVARIRNAMLANLELSWRLARVSPQAADLLDAKDRLAGPIFADADRRIIAALAVTLTELGVRDPGQAAFMLLMAGKGIANAADGVATLQSCVTLLVESCLRGMKAASRAKA